MKKYILASGMFGLALGAGIVLVGAGWVVPVTPGDGKVEKPREPGTISVPQPEGNLVCFGSVDVGGGVLSLYPAVPGRVAEIPVHEGQAVKTGTVLLRLEEQVAAFQLAEAQAALKAADAQLKKARQGPKLHQYLLAQQKAGLLALGHDLESARLLATSKDKLVASKFLAAEEAAAAWEQYKKVQAGEKAERAKLASLELADPDQDIERAEADVQAKKAQLDKASHALEQCAVKAPVDGTITRLLVGRGEVLGPMPKQPAIVFCPSSARIIRAEVEQEFAGWVALGQQAVIQDETRNNDASCKGKVIRIADMYTPRRTNLPVVLPTQEARVLEFVVELEPTSVPLRIGQRVRVKLLKEPAKQ